MTRLIALSSILLTVLACACGSAQPGSASPAPDPAPHHGHDMDSHGHDMDSHGHDPAHHGGHGGAGHHDDPEGAPEAYRHTGDGVRHDFSDVERFARVFDDPARDGWQRPEEVVRLLALAPGQVVVDLGAGTGYFLPHLAPAVQPGGQVIALDVEPAMVEHMRTRIARAALAGAQARVVAPDEPGLAPGSVDRILVVNTWHHIGKRVTYARKLHRALRPGGRVLVVDFTQETDKGPPRHARLLPEQVLRELREAGFQAELLDASLPDQYVVQGTR